MAKRKGKKRKGKKQVTENHTTRGSFLKKPNVKRISLDVIKPYKHNPAERLEYLDDLMESIEEHKLRNPIHVVRGKNSGEYFVVGDGHRRSEALRQLGETHVWAIVHDDMTAEQLMTELNKMRTLTGKDWTRIYCNSKGRVRAPDKFHGPLKQAEELGILDELGNSAPTIVNVVKSAHDYIKRKLDEEVDHKTIITWMKAHRQQRNLQDALHWLTPAEVLLRAFTEDKPLKRIERFVVDELDG